MNNSKLWSFNFVCISLTNFFTHIVFYLLMATIAMYVMSEYGAGQGIAGLIVGVYVVAALVARILAGMFMDRIGRKRTIVIGLVIFFIAMVCHYFATSIIIIILLRTMQGFAHGLITNTAAAVVVNFIPVHRRGEGLGYYATFMNVAMAVGPFLGIFLSQHSNFKIVIIICSIIAFLGLLSVLRLKIPESDISAQKRIQEQKFNINNLIEFKSIPISFVMFSIALVYSSLLTFLSLFGEEAQLETTVSYFFIVYAVALLVTRPFTGRFFDTHGENAINYPLLVILGVGFIILSQSFNSLMLFTAAAFIGIGYGTLQSNFQAIAIKVADHDRTAQATTTYWVALDLGTGLGPYLIGTVVGFMSYSSMYMLVGIWIFVCLVFYFVFHGRKAARMKEQLRQ